MSIYKGKVMVGVVLSMLLSACQYHTYAPPTNKAPVDVTTSEAETPKPNTPQVMDEKSGPAVQSPAYYEAVLSVKDASFEQIRDQVLNPLAKNVLNAKSLATPSLTSSNDFFRYLRIYDQALITLADLGPERPEVVQAYKDFAATVLAPCLASRNQCANLRVMAKDSRYAAVIMNTIKVLKPDSETAWKYSFYAQDFSSIPLSDAYQAQFYETFVDYLKTIPKSRVGDAAEKFNQIVVATNGNGPSLQNFLERIDIWSQDGKDAAVQLDSQIRQSLRKAIWSNLIRYQTLSSNGAPTPSFARWMKAELGTFGTLYIDSFQQSEISQRIWTSFQLTDPRQPLIANATLAEKQTASNLTFIFDQTFSGKLERADALTLLAALNPKQDDVIKVAQSYVRVRFATMMLATQRDLKSKLGSPEHYKNIRELNESLQSAEKMQVQWASFLSQFNALRDIIETTAATHDADMTPELLDRMTTTFGQMDRDIKWFVTYPNMLPVLYYISKANLSDEIDILWFKINLNSDLIFKILINGDLGMWFNFTNSMDDSSNFSTPEVVFAFRNALEGEVFSTYGISPGSFLLEAVDRLLTDTTVTLDNATDSLYRKMYVGVEYDHFDNSQTNAFMNASDFCNGKPVTETLKLEELQYSIVGPEEALINTLSNLRMFDMRVGGRTSDDDVLDINMLNDKLRTDNFYYLDLVEKMIGIYKDYLAHYNMSDENMQLVDQKIAQIHQRMRKYFGLEYQGVNRYGQCIFYVADLANKRQFQALDYEKRYLQQAYKDSVTLSKDPSQLASTNARYTRDFGDLKMASHDHFEIVGQKVVFIYNQLDFIMRLKDYLQKGAIDPATGEQLSAIAPGMVISLPDNPKTAGQFYKKVNAGGQTHTVVLEPSDDESAFLLKAMAIFNNGIGYMSYAPDFHVYPFEEWMGAMTALSTSEELGFSREAVEGSLMKLGDVEAYDFEKRDCDPRKAYADLDKTCVTTMNITADRVFAESKRLAEMLSLNQPTVDVLKSIKTETIMGDRHIWYDVFFSQVDQKPIGLLDPYLYMASSQLGGGNLNMPGHQSDPNSNGGPLPRLGRLDQAKIYFAAFGSHAPDFFTTPDQLDGNLKDLYTGYAQKEFAQSYAIEAKAAEETAKAQGPFLMRLETTAEPYPIPISTTYAQPAKTREQIFNSSTDFIFAKTK